MKDDKINEENAKTLIQLFAITFFNQEVALSKITPLSGYETENYMTFEDSQGNVYLVQLNKNMIIKYINNSEVV